MGRLFSDGEMPQFTASQQHYLLIRTKSTSSTRSDTNTLPTHIVHKAKIIGRRASALVVQNVALVCLACSYLVVDTDVILC